MRHREASALALVAVLQGRRQQPRLHHLGPGTPIHLPSSMIQPSSTLRHPLSLGATPVVDEQDDLDLENDGLGDLIIGESSLVTSTRSNQTSIEAVQKQGISVNESEAAGAILLLNLVAVLWGTQVSNLECTYGISFPLVSLGVETLTCTFPYGYLACSHQNGSRRFLCSSLYATSICVGGIDCGALHAGHLPFQ